MFTTLLVALSTVIAADTDLEAKAVIRKWAEARKDVHAVHVTFDCFQYDMVFRSPDQPEISSGEVHFTSRTNGFWSDGPKKAKDGDVKRGTRFIWKDDTITIVDEEKKRYDQGPRDTSVFGWQLFPYVNASSPFLPGLPDKTALDGWKFTILADSDDEVMLEGVPPKTMAKRFRGCQLILRKPDMTLHAVQYVNPNGKDRSVFVFKDVKHNPEKMPDVDLSEYTARSIFLPSAYLSSDGAKQ